MLISIRIKIYIIIFNIKIFMYSLNTLLSINNMFFRRFKGRLMFISIRIKLTNSSIIFIISEIFKFQPLILHLPQININLMNNFILIHLSLLHILILSPHRIQSNLIIFINFFHHLTPSISFHIASLSLRN